MAGGWLKTLAFLSSYAPLWLLLSIQAWQFHWAASAALVALAIVMPLLILGVLRGYRRRMASTDELVAQTVTRRDSDVVAYLFTYVLPFLSFKLEEWVQAMTASVFVVFLFLLFIRTNLQYVNPILTFAGYRVYEVQPAGAPNKFVITKRRFLRVGEPLPVYRLGDEDVCIDLTKETPA